MVFLLWFGDLAHADFWAAVLVYVLLAALLATTARIFYRVIRAGVILVRGWPPPHLDADGDAIDDGEPPEADAEVRDGNLSVRYRGTAAYVGSALAGEKIRCALAKGDGGKYRPGI